MLENPQVGDGVRTVQGGEWERQGTGRMERLAAHEQLVITRVYSQRVIARTVQEFVETSGWQTVTRGRSYSFAYRDLEIDGTVDERARRRIGGRSILSDASGRHVPVRRLGKKPDDTEDMTYIGTDHPGIQWLFEDMGRYATDQGWCSQYDALVARLGIPGRPREFDVVRQHNGLAFTTRVRARSQAEANQLVDAALNPKTEPETTPSEPEPQAA